MKKIILGLLLVLASITLSAQSTFKSGIQVGKTGDGDRVKIDSIIAPDDTIKFYSGATELILEGVGGTAGDTGVIVPSFFDVDSMIVGGGAMVYPGAGIAYSTGAAWGASNVTNKAQVELEDSAVYANGYMSNYDGVTGLALKLNKADSAVNAGGYTSYYDGIVGLLLKLNLADSANYASGYMSRYDGVTGDAGKVALADSGVYAGGYVSPTDLDAAIAGVGSVDSSWVSADIGILVSDSINVDTMDVNQMMYNSAGNYSAKVAFASDGVLDLKVYADDDWTGRQTGTQYNENSISDYASDAAGLEKSITIYAAAMLVKDDQDSIGLVYEYDYKENFTSNSLVNKAYTDSLVVIASDSIFVTVTGDTVKINTIAVPDASQGADLGLSGTRFNKVFSDTTDANTILVNTIIKPDANQGANAGASGAAFNLMYADSIHANWFGGSDFTLGVANDKLTFNGDTLTATSANFRSLESYVGRLRVGASAGSFLLDSITKSGTTIKFYDGATELEPSLTLDTVALETVVQLLSDSAVVIPFLMGSGQTGDTALFNDGAICGSFYNYKDTLVAVYFNGVMSAGTGTETMTIDIKWHATFQDGSAVELNSSPLEILSLTTGTTDASFNNSIIPPGVRVWGIVAGIDPGNRPSYFEGSLVCYRQNRRY